MNPKINPKATYSLLLICASTLFLHACSSDDKNANSTFDEAPASINFLHEPDNIYTEDFPLWRFVVDGDGYNLANISAIDIEFPHAMVLQKGTSFGVIDAGQEDLPYARHIAAGILHAHDFTHIEDRVWSVEADESVYLNRATFDGSGFSLDASYRRQGAVFTEIAYGSNANQVWLYNEADHTLGALMPNSEVDAEHWRFYVLDDDIDIVDLTVEGSHLMVTYHYQGSLRVNVFDAAGDGLQVIESWEIVGYPNKVATDASFLPDGRMLVSFEGLEENLYLVAKHEPEPSVSPLAPVGELTLDHFLDFNTAITQPSGFAPRSDGSWFVLTDQREVFIVKSDFSVIEHQGHVSFDGIACIQGCTEGIATVDDNHFLVITDSATVGYFSVQAQGYQRESQFALEISVGDRFSGIAFDPIRQFIYVINDNDNENTQDALYTFDYSDGFSLVSRVFVNGGAANVSPYDAQGISYDNDQLFVVSEAFTQVLVLNLQGEVEYTLGFNREDVEEASDIAIYNGRVYIPSDNEDGEPAPSVGVYFLP